MAYSASASIEIAAPPATVWAWITERGKLNKWVEGKLDMMPADPSELRVGYRGTTSFTTPDGRTSELEVEVTAFEPPHLIAYDEGYQGSKTHAEFRLSESGGGTRVDATTSTDWSKPEIPELQAAEQQVSEMPQFAQVFARSQMQKAMEMFQHSDENPAVKAEMERQFNESLSSLKAAVESGG